jgi:hypothetical protein
MIFVKEHFLDHNTVEIRMEGILDSDSIPVIRKVVDQYITGGKKIILNNHGLIHISREGKEFLKNIATQGIITSIPNY